MSQDCAAVPQDCDIHSMLRAILDQNSLILAQNADMNARLVEVEKVQQRSQHMRTRPRSKCSDGFPWKCPVCPQQLKHLDSFLSHIRKFAVHTIHRAAKQKVSKARCCFHLDNPQHLQLIDKFIGDSDAEKAASFAKHFLNLCRSISASRSSVADKHSRIMDWLHRAQHDTTFATSGECPSVSDMSSSGHGAVTSSSGSDVGHCVRLCRSAV
jgi:hypothetical protein